eukprot:m.126858 g.126858  ORF g.126858 m.126858 type:complete len:737 (-) comp29223_c0_seq5:133-2343(-)
MDPAGVTQFDVDYVGAVPVAASVPSANLWAMFGPKVIEQASKKLKILNPKTVPGALLVGSSKITVLEKSTGNLLDDEHIESVKYAQVHPTDKKKVVYVIYYSHIGILYAHTLCFKKKTAASEVVDCINAAKTAAEAVASDDTYGFNSDFIFNMTQPKAFNNEQNASEIASLGQTIGIIESIRYVGTMPLKMKGVASGELAQVDVERGATFMLGQLKVHAGRTRKKDRRLSFVSRKAAADADPLAGLPVVLVVSSEGIRTIDNISREETHRVFLQDLAFFSPLTVKGDKDGELFGAVSKDNRLRHVRMRVYRCAKKGQAEEICEVIRDAFKAANRADELRNGRPFMPIASLSTEVQTPLSHLENDRSQISPIHPIGAGQFGLVFLANANFNNAEEQQVAVKVLRPGPSVSTMGDFLREAENLNKMDHPNIVKLLGVCLKAKPWLILEEFVVFGDLDTVLKACEEKDVDLTEVELMLMIRHIVCGATYVASLQVVHSDYAARNCLVHRNNHIKIADFGWSRQLAPGKKSFVRADIPKISTRWLAPECIDRKEFSEKSDVWAVGVTIWEVFTNASLPYKDVHFLQVHRLVKEGLRESRPPNCSNLLFAVLEKTWEFDPAKRPKLAEFEKKIMAIEVAKDADTRIRDIGRVLEQTEAPSEERMRLASEDEYSYNEEDNSNATTTTTTNAHANATAPRPLSGVTTPPSQNFSQISLGDELDTNEFGGFDETDLISEEQEMV